MMAVLLLAATIVTKIVRRAGQASMTDFETSSEPDGFSIALPEGWVGGAGTGVPEGVAYQARLSVAEESDPPTEATLTVVFQTLEGSNDPQAMVDELAAAGHASEVQTVELAAGPAVRRVGPDDVSEVTGRQYYVPVPGTDNQIAVLSFVSSASPEKERLDEMFEAMAKTFAWA